MQCQIFLTKGMDLEVAGLACSLGVWCVAYPHSPFPFSGTTWASSISRSRPKDEKNVLFALCNAKNTPEYFYIYIYRCSLLVQKSPTPPETWKTTPVRSSIFYFDIIAFPARTFAKVWIIIIVVVVGNIIIITWLSKRQIFQNQPNQEKNKVWSSSHNIISCLILNDRTISFYLLHTIPTPRWWWTLRWMTRH